MNELSRLLIDQYLQEIGQLTGAAKVLVKYLKTLGAVEFEQNSDGSVDAHFKSVEQLLAARSKLIKKYDVLGDERLSDDDWVLTVNPSM